MLGDFVVHGTVTREERDAQVKTGIGSFLQNVPNSTTPPQPVEECVRACQNCGGFSRDAPCCSLGTDCYSCMDCCCPDCHSCKNFHCKCTDSEDSDESTDSGESQTESDESE